MLVRSPAFCLDPGMAVYYASKAYVLSLTEALRGELAPRACASRSCVPVRCRRNFRRGRDLSLGFDSAILNVSPLEVAKAGYRGLMANKRVVPARPSASRSYRFCSGCFRAGYPVGGWIFSAGEAPINRSAAFLARDLLVN